MKQIFLLLFSSITTILVSQSIDNNSNIGTKKHTYQDSTIKVNKNNVPINKMEYYFPLALFPKVEFDWNQDSSGVWIITNKIIEGKQDTFVVSWYSEHLYAMKEPLLFNKNLHKEAYRFTWLRTFSNPIIVRIEKEGEKYNLFWKLCDGAGGYDPGNLIINKSKEINAETWNLFKSKIDSLDYWNMENGRISIGNDGSEWILEGVENEKYQVVTVWSPEKGSYYDVCNYLLTLTDLELSKKEKY